MGERDKLKKELRELDAKIYELKAEKNIIKAKLLRLGPGSPTEKEDTQ